MKPILKNILVPTISAVIGGVVVVSVLKMSPSMLSKLESEKAKTQKNEAVFDDILKKQDGIRDHFDSLFNDDFFNQKDPFEEMKKMREQMEKRMERFTGRPHATNNPFDSWFSNKFGGGTIDDITKREDENFVYYDIKVSDLNATSINTKIENGYITITGTIEKKNESKNDKDGVNNMAQSFFKSSFNRTFPLPDHVDQNKMQMIPEKDKIVLKFPKLHT